jgi:hypothetical protein
MTDIDYRTALVAEMNKLAQLEAAKKRTEDEILRCRRRIASLSELVKDADEKKSALTRRLVESLARYNVEQSLTDDIRKIIRAAGQFGIPKDAIRSELSKLGNSIENHSNPSGTVNSIVKRLVEKGEVEEASDLLGFNTVVKWKEMDFWQWFMKEAAKQK